MGMFDGLKNFFGSSKSSTKKVEIAKRFNIRGQTGQGSMSKVYQAFDNNLGRSVCLKILDKAKTAKFEERFTIQKLIKPSEGVISISLNHLNLVKTYEHGLTTNGEPFVVMEWIDGKGLNFLIETRSTQLNGKRIDYLTQLCEAMEYLHAQKYLHRDLCPRNIMVSNEGIVKLIDFGLAVPYTPEFCRPGNRTGTADYLAPEVIRRMTTDHRLDIFALGVTAFEIFTGELPWERALTSEETLRRHLNTVPRQLTDLKPDIDPVINKIVMRMIEREPKDRYASVRVVRDLISKFAGRV